MAGKIKFDQEAAFKAIIGSKEHVVQEEPSQQVPRKEKKEARVQRAYFIDVELDKALRRMACEEGKNLTECVNELFRKGLEKYIHL